MAGAVAFVFGLCALSFAAGCVVTAVMLRTSSPEEEVAPPLTDPVVPAPRPERLEVRPLGVDLTAKPVHRNPVVSRPLPAVMEPAMVDLTFTGVFDSPSPLPPFAPLPASAGDRGVELVEEVDELADEVPELLPEGDSDVGQEPLAVNGEAPVVSSAADQFFLAYAARQDSGSRSESEPVAVPEPVSEVEQVTPADPEPRVDDVEPAASVPVVIERQAASFEQVREPSSRNGRRREIKLELVPQESVPQPTSVAESQPAPTPAAELPAGVPEPETVFVSCSGLVTEPEPEPEPGPEHLDAVVPEQGVGPEPELVPTQQAPVPSDEFRKRYLRTFEAARRRSPH